MLKGVEAFAGECLRDLLDMSAKLLRLGGRLVYFMPAAPEVYKEKEIPRHPALRLVANSEQVLSTKFSRRLITMEKVSHMPCNASLWVASHAAVNDLLTLTPMLNAAIAAHKPYEQHGDRCAVTLSL